MYRIFIVEDDEVIASSLKKQLELWDFECFVAENYKNITEEFCACDPQLVLLDISLPYYNGYHWCEEIRKISKVPIIFVSSVSDNMNIVMAVSLGGDDFISKPFSMEVLVAKIQAVMRRTYDFAGVTGIMSVRGVVLNTSECCFTYEGEKVELSKNENRILGVLFRNRGSVVSRDTLMNKLWETDSFVDENTLSVNMTRLRRKLDGAGVHELIKTKKGMGYIVE